MLEELAVTNVLDCVKTVISPGFIDLVDHKGVVSYRGYTYMLSLGQWSIWMKAKTLLWWIHPQAMMERLESDHM